MTEQTNRTVDRPVDFTVEFHLLAEMCEFVIVRVSLEPKVLPSSASDVSGPNKTTNVGPPHCRTEMYADRIARCLTVSHGEYADGTDRQTDGRTHARPLHYAFY